MEIIFEVDGMNNENSRKYVEKAIKSVKGVKKVKISLEDKYAAVIYNRTKTSEQIIKDAVINAGSQAW